MPLRNLIIVAVSIIVSLVCYSAAAKNRYANLFAEAMDLIDTQSLKEVPRKQLFNSAMSGMLKDLDEHSMFITGDMYKEFREDMQQEFGGVGMYVENNPLNNRLIVLAPMPGTPAFAAGLTVGDEIVEINGANTEGMIRSEAVKLLRGPINEAVELVVERAGKRIKNRLVRASIPVQSVYGDWRNPDGSWNYVLKENPRIGYIRLIQFGDKSGTEIKEALQQVEGKIDGLVLDLRNNPGGLLHIAIEICDDFLAPDQVVVSTRGRNGKMKKEYRSSTLPIVKPDLPLVILVNRNSASASEIVAGCLQDLGRAVIIGEQSWGKGTVQDVIPMQRNESALKLTTASYWRPSGRHIDRFDEIAKRTKIWGVQPDEGFVVAMTEEGVFDDMRYRSIRDIEGLMPPGSEVTLEAIRNFRLHADDGSETNSDVGPMEEGNSDKAKPLISPTPDESDSDVVPDADVKADDDQSDNQPHIDRPLERAIEYFKAVLGKRQIAA